MRTRYFWQCGFRISVGAKNHASVRASKRTVHRVSGLNKGLEYRIKYFQVSLTYALISVNDIVVPLLLGCLVAHFRTTRYCTKGYQLNIASPMLQLYM
jgi:hypothetical protein